MEYVIGVDFDNTIAGYDDLAAKFSPMTWGTWKHVVVIGPSPDVSVYRAGFHFLKHFHRNIEVSRMHYRSRRQRGVGNLQITHLRKIETQIDRVFKCRNIDSMG